MIGINILQKLALRKLKYPAVPTTQRNREKNQKIEKYVVLTYD